ncbi:V-set and immunoglobulin domain-containing protein 1-like [Megalops cyprinoides]|uniref:V-set and immunoglobulin domain-containing protein 1-like n=1 Tax=Megalops cyprinoides TaxID=118141 RepID=UPI001864D001|nr:V-set and immunoglobulin domain-containing protein 1-like [Megalops cyprinoides]
MGCVHLIAVTTTHKFVNVTTGQSVFLQCSFATTSPTTGLNIEWSFVPRSGLTNQQVYYYQSGQSVITANYKGRVTGPYSPNTTYNASITISNMKPSDSGIYTCDVHNIPDVQGTSEVNINVMVLEKPSVPFCAVHGTVEAGHLVSLTCHTEQGNPPPTYTWTQLNQGRSRSALGETNFQTGVMYIRNLSQFQFGEYQCNASNVVGFTVCTVELVEDLGDGAIAGAVIAAVLGAALIIFLVWYITHHLRKSKYKAAKAAGATEMESGPQSSDSVKYESVPTKERAHQTSSNAVSVPQESAPSPVSAQGQEEEAEA